MQQREQMIDVFLEINSQINLSAIREREGVWIKHIQDSLELTKIIDFASIQTLCDVGTGGGFPLLALAQYIQDHNYKIRCYGIDARRKKVDAINGMIEKL